MDRSITRQSGLLLVAFLATLLLLAGAFALLTARGGGPGSTRSPVAGGSPAAVPSPGSGASGRPGPSIVPGASGLPGVLPSANGPSSSPPADAILTGAGDIADCSLSGDQETSDLLINQPGTIFTAGDNAYENGSAQDYASCYEPTWGRVRNRTMPAPGNHDYQTDKAAGYLGYFGAAAAPGGTTWYSTDLAMWHVIVLDSTCARVGGCTADSPQGRWLADDLAAHKDTRCTLAIWHHPRFSSGEHGNDPSVGPFWDQLVAARADLVINGHDHDYERFSPQDAAGNEDRTVGLRQIVVGTGGAGLRGFTRSAPNSEFRLSGVWGVIRLTLHPANYDWEFLPTSGRIADSGSALCH